MHSTLIVNILIGVLSGIGGGAIQALATWFLTSKSFKLTRKSEVYGFFVFSASGLLKSKSTESYDFHRMTNEAIAKVALYGSEDVLSALSQFTATHDLTKDAGYRSLLSVIQAMRRDLETKNSPMTEKILNSISLRQEKSNNGYEK